MTRAARIGSVAVSRQSVADPQVTPIQRACNHAITVSLVSDSTEWWRVVDHAESPGHGVYEDAIGVAGPLAWVIDGASPLTAEKVTGADSDARWLVDVAEEHLRHAAERDNQEPLEDIVAAIAEDVRTASAGWSRKPAIPPSAAVGLVRRRGDLIDYLVLTDVLIAMDGEAAWVWTDDAVVRTNTRAMHEFRSALAETGSFEAAHARVRPLLQDHRARCMNRTGGYWALADDPSAARHAIKGELAARQAGPTLLCTDGFSRLVDCFEIYSSWQDFLRSGTPLDHAVRQLREAERADPDAIDFPRWSVFDDASALIVAPI